VIGRRSSGLCASVGDEVDSEAILRIHLPG